MKDTGIFYGSSSGKTALVATRILEKLGNEKAGIHDIAVTGLGGVMDYRNLILGISTWGNGELQEDWMAVLPELEDLDLHGKKVALFGLGDQESYPDTFADALGMMYDILYTKGCMFTGEWSTEAYHFEASKALRGNDFVGLVLDVENQDDLTELRVDNWLRKLDLI